MFKKKNKIYIKDWMALKPYEKQSKIVFPLKENPFDDKRTERSGFFGNIFSDFHFKEMLQFCLTNFKEDLAFFQRKGRYSENEFDFLRRFFKNTIYQTKPQITLSGKS